MRRYSEAAWERAMKVQEVILRAMAKRIVWWQAAEIIGISNRACGACGNGMKSTATIGCSTGGGAYIHIHPTHRSRGRLPGAEERTRDPAAVSSD